MTSASTGPSSPLPALTSAGRATPTDLAQARRPDAPQHVALKEVNDVRKLLKRGRPERRPQRMPIPQAELDEMWRRAWLEAAKLPRISL